MLGRINETIRSFIGVGDKDLSTSSRKRPLDRSDEHDVGTPSKKLRTNYPDENSSSSVFARFRRTGSSFLRKVAESLSPVKVMKKLTSSSDLQQSQNDPRRGMHPQVTQIPHIQQDMRGMPLAHSTPDMRSGYTFSNTRDFTFQKCPPGAVRPRMPPPRPNNGSVPYHRPYIHQRQFAPPMHHSGDMRHGPRKPVYGSYQQQQPDRRYSSRFASKESTRLKEKEEYKRLLQRYTEEVPSLPCSFRSGASRQKNISRQSSLSETVLGSERSPICLDQKPAVDHTFERITVRSTSVDESISTTNRPLTSLPDRSIIELQETVIQSHLPTKSQSVPNAAVSSHRETDLLSNSKTDQSARSTFKEAKSPFSPRSASSRTFVNDYREKAEWIDKLVSDCSPAARKKDSEIRTFEARREFYKGKIEEIDENLEKMVKDRLTLAEKVPVPLEEPVEEEEEDDLIELSDDQEARVDSVFARGNPNEILSEGFKLQITRRDLLTLKGLEWLNDEVINFYMNLLMERGQQDNYSSVHAFNTFFYPKVIKGGQSSVARWTRRGNIDIFSKDYVLVPVHLGMHWCLSVIDMKKKEVRYYDSMGGSNNQCLEGLRQYLLDEHKDKKKAPFDMSGWKMINVKDIPQQMNGSDCGMFTCKFAEYITRDAKITFAQENMPYFRRRMVMEILTKRLL